MAEIFKFFAKNQEHINFNSFTRFSRALFEIALFDFNVLQGDATMKERICYFLKTVYVKFCLATFALALVLLTLLAIVNADNLVIAASTSTNWLTIALIGHKYFITFWYKDGIKGIFQEIQIIFDNRLSKRSPDDIQKYFYGFQRLIKLYSVTFILIFLPITFPAIPYLSCGAKKISIGYWYPFDPYRDEYFPFVLCWIDWIAINCVIFLLSTDSMIYAFITIISMEFDFLKADLMNVGNVQDSEKARNIHSLIDHHNRLFDISDKLQKVFSSTFLFSFVVSSVIMCFIAFQLSTAARDFSKYLMLVPYFGVIGGQVWLLCMFGQKLIVSSESVADGIYNCQWEHSSDNSLKKKIILIIQRSQRTKRLTAMGFADISLESFTTVYLSLEV